MSGLLIAYRGLKQVAWEHRTAGERVY